MTQDEKKIVDILSNWQRKKITEEQLDNAIIEHIEKNSEYIKTNVMMIVWDKLFMQFIPIEEAVGKDNMFYKNIQDIDWYIHKWCVDWIKMTNDSTKKDDTQDYVRAEYISMKEFNALVFDNQLEYKTYHWRTDNAENGIPHTVKYVTIHKDTNGELVEWTAMSEPREGQ